MKPSLYWLLLGYGLLMGAGFAGAIAGCSGARI